MSIYETEDSVQKSFDTESMPEELLQAQWAEFIELKKVITEQFGRQKRPVTILDIGVGSARVPKHLSGIPEIWNMIAQYDGIDNAYPCINLSKKLAAELNIEDKFSVHFLEAHQLPSLNKKFDLIITTWFTPGNFYPDDFSFETYDPGRERLDLTLNKKFIEIFSSAYHLLNNGGEIVLGACYLDNDATRIKQENFYKQLGMTIITDTDESFTATKEKFWSQRFTEEKIYRYFSYAPPENISFTPLDTYKFAIQVRVRK
jgi:hypothetical protein